MTKQDAVDRAINRMPIQKMAYEEARKGRKNVSVAVPESYLPVLLLALDHFYTAYSFGAECRQDREVVTGLLMAALGIKQVDPVCSMLGAVDDGRREYQEAHE